MDLSATNVSGKEKRGNEKCRRKEIEYNSRWGEVRQKLYSLGSGTLWTGEAGFRVGLDVVVILGIEP